MAVSKIKSGIPPATHAKEASAPSLLGRVGGITPIALSSFKMTATEKHSSLRVKLQPLIDSLHQETRAALSERLPSSFVEGAVRSVNQDLLREILIVPLDYRALAQDILASDTTEDVCEYIFNKVHSIVVLGDPRFLFKHHLEKEKAINAMYISARGIRDPLKKDTALQTCFDRYLSLGGECLLKAVVILNHEIQSDIGKSQSTEHLKLACLDTRDLLVAESVAREIPDEKIQSIILSELVSKYIIDGTFDIEKAEEIALSIPNKELRSGSIEQIMLYLCEKKDLVKAQEFIDRMQGVIPSGYVLEMLSNLKKASSVSAMQTFLDSLTSMKSLLG